MKRTRMTALGGLALAALLLIACQGTTAEVTPPTLEATAITAAEPAENLLAGVNPVEIERAPDVPALPFPDNPDPNQCGIPTTWSSDAPAYLSGLYEGELIQPIVFLYDSHLRREITVQAPHGSEIKILLSQSNPQLDYFYVKVVGAEQPNEGWVPAPFVSFEKPAGL